MTSGTTAQEGPEKIDVVDALRYENVLLRVQNLDMQAQGIETQRAAARAQLDSCGREINEKYKLTQQDRVDLSTCLITRAQQPVAGEIDAKEEAKPAEKPKKAPKA